MLEFLNGNAGAIQAIATVILVLITGWYAKTTHDLVRLTKEKLIADRRADDLARSAADHEVISIARSLLRDVSEMVPRFVPEVETKMRSDAWRENRDQLILTGVTASPGVKVHAEAAANALTEWDALLGDARRGRGNEHENAVRLKDLIREAERQLKMLVGSDK